MGYIDNLLRGRKVEWKALGKVANFTRGKNLSKADRGLGNTPMILYGELYTSYGNYIDLVESHTSEVRANRTPTTKQGDLVMPLSSTTKDAKIGKVSAVEVHFSVHIGMDALILTHAQNTHYLVHLLNSQWFEQRKMGCVTGTTIMHLSPKKLATLPIPLPPLDVQAEIARILDRFTALEAALKAELEARQKQYEYYRDRLLSADDTVRHFKLTPLGDIGEVRMCKRILKGQTSERGEVPFYKIGTFGGTPDAFISRELFNDYRSKYNYPKVGDILISASGTIGRTIVFDGKEAYFQDSNIVWIENDERYVLNAYLHYCYQVARWEVTKSGTIQRLYNENLRRTLIPIPFPGDRKKSLAEQERIVRILDKFSTLTTSLTAGLPREIALRRRQYEYYREQLLTFE